MKNTIFKGMATALVTPMTETGVDYDGLRKLVNWQIEQGVHALVVIGTTGEASTLSAEEKRAVVRCVVETAAHRVPVIAGTGANCTAHAIENTRMACEEGVDAVLVVTPYYNKATQSGLVAHFTAVADASSVPVILYNVPGRTGCNLLPATVKKLASHEKIVGVKEASGNMAQVVEIFQKCGDRLDVYSGEDGLVVPMLSMGGMGCISVLSNVVPKQSVEMCDKFFAGDVAGAAELQLELLELVNCLFCEVNPIPVKAAISAMGFGTEHLRLPLTPMEPKNRERLYAELKRLGVL
jgi:4-hydroxy-tetrahydrodipicolinate synthase